MVKISNDINVGLDIFGICDFYSDLVAYKNSLENYLKSLDFKDIILNRLNIYVQNGILIEEYHIKKVDENLIVVSETNIKTKKTNWDFMDVSNKIDFKYTLDLEYFIQNN